MIPNLKSLGYSDDEAEEMLKIPTFEDSIKRKIEKIDNIEDLIKGIEVS